MIHPSKKFITPEQYLTLEEQAGERHEYHNGEIYNLAGASSNHNLIAGNVYIDLRRSLATKSCRVYTTDMRLGIEKPKSYLYPDIMVVCGKIETDLRQKDTVTNPLVLVEVWSESTEEYDRGRKFPLYRRIPSLQDYVMIDQSQPYVEHYRRDGHFWVLESIERLRAKLELGSLKIGIPMQTIYEQVEWEEKPKQGKRNKKQ